MPACRGGTDAELLQEALRRARTSAGLTQREVAEAMGFSESKLLRIEGGVVSVSTTDLKALLRYYQITDRREVDELVELARTIRKRTFRPRTASRATRS